MTEESVQLEPLLYAVQELVDNGVSSKVTCKQEYDTHNSLMERSHSGDTNINEASEPVPWVLTRAVDNSSPSFLLGHEQQPVKADEAIEKMNHHSSLRDHHHASVPDHHASVQDHHASVQDHHASVQDHHALGKDKPPQQNYYSPKDERLEVDDVAVDNIWDFDKGDTLLDVKPNLNTASTDIVSFNVQNINDCRNCSQNSCCEDHNNESQTWDEYDNFWRNEPDSYYEDGIIYRPGCPFCGFIVKPMQWRSHQKFHMKSSILKKAVIRGVFDMKSRIYYCTFCTASFRLMRQYIYHTYTMHRRHVNEDFQCVFKNGVKIYTCRRNLKCKLLVFENREALYNHLKEHTTEEQLNLDESQESETKLTFHVQVHKDPVINDCTEQPDSVMDNSAVENSSLEVTKEMFTGKFQKPVKKEAIFKCKICPLNCATKEEVEFHVKTCKTETLEGQQNGEAEDAAISRCNGRKALTENSNKSVDNSARVTCEKKDIIEVFESPKSDLTAQDAGVDSADGTFDCIDVVADNTSNIERNQEKMDEFDGQSIDCMTRKSEEDEIVRTSTKDVRPGINLGMNWHENYFDVVDVKTIVHNKIENISDLEITHTEDNKQTDVNKDYEDIGTKCRKCLERDTDVCKKRGECNAKENYPSVLAANKDTSVDAVLLQNRTEVHNLVSQSVPDVQQVCKGASNNGMYGLTDSVPHSNVNEVQKPTNCISPDSQCSFCQKLVEKDKFANHLKETHMREFYSSSKIAMAVCKVCTVKLLSEADLEEHIEKVHASNLVEDIEINSFRCKLCSLNIKSQQEVQKHIMRKHQSEMPGSVEEIFTASKIAMVKCRFCVSLFLTEEECYEHVRSAHWSWLCEESEVDIYCCSLCSLNIKSVKEIESHVLKKHLDQLVLKHCVMVTTNKYTLCQNSLKHEKGFDEPGNDTPSKNGNGTQQQGERSDLEICVHPSTYDPDYMSNVKEHVGEEDSERDMSRLKEVSRTCVAEPDISEPLYMSVDEITDVDQEHFQSTEIDDNFDIGDDNVDVADDESGSVCRDKELEGSISEVTKGLSSEEIKRKCEPISKQKHNSTTKTKRDHSKFSKRYYFRNVGEVKVTGSGSYPFRKVPSRISKKQVKPKQQCSKQLVHKIAEENVTRPLIIESKIVSRYGFQPRVVRKHPRLQLEVRRCGRMQSKVVVEKLITSDDASKNLKEMTRPASEIIYEDKESEMPKSQADKSEDIVNGSEKSFYAESNYAGSGVEVHHSSLTSEEESVNSTPYTFRKRKKISYNYRKNDNCRSDTDGWPLSKKCKNTSGPGISAALNLKYGKLTAQQNLRSKSNCESKLTLTHSRSGLGINDDDYKKDNDDSDDDENEDGSTDDGDEDDYSIDDDIDNDSDFGLEMEEEFEPLNTEKKVKSKPQNDSEQKDSIIIYSCAVCHKEFKTEKELEKHSQIHVKLVMFVCQYCKKKFSSGLHRRKHEEFCSKSYGLSACDMCGYKANDVISARIHVSQHKNFTPYVCPLCYIRTNSYEAIIDHFKKCHKNEFLHLQIPDQSFVKYSLQCDICSRKYVSRNGLRRHYLDHVRVDAETGAQKYKCCLCKDSFIDREDTKKHFTNHAKTFILECPICSLRFAEKKPYNTHVKNHSGKKPVMCKECNQVFSCYGTWRYHHIKVHRVQVYQCKICDKIYSSSKTLEMHMKYVHEKVQKFHCKLCGKGFAKRFQVKQHQLVHKQVKSI